MIDLLHWPVLGRLLRWRWGRLAFQVPLLLLALLMIFDGLTGPQLAPLNIATVAAWIHYRGLVMLALLLAGNLFCMSCPFTLPRTLARRLSVRGRRWPQPLRNKWLAIAGLVGIFWLYEAFDLWASPWLTAWLAVAYFAAAFALEALFSESAFCKYVCPLGTFNFVQSAVSSLQITARDAQICLTCEGHECVRGSARTSGCGTELFVPQIRSNLDCTFCLDCARACPYDNVALAVRAPLRELTQAGAWPRRWDLAVLVVVLTAIGLSNAFGMVPPMYILEEWLARRTGIRNEALLVALILGVAGVLLPVALGVGAAWLSRWLAGGRASLREVFAHYAPAFAPLGFAIWLAHYGFHFATGALTIIPVAQQFLLDYGLAWLGGSPNWSLGAVMPASWLLPLQTLCVLLGFVGSLYVVGERAQQLHATAAAVRRATLPWLVLLLALALAAVYIFSLPMEMRGTLDFMS